MWKRHIERMEAAGRKPADDLLLVSIATQRLIHLRSGQERATYVCSTSSRPPSCVQDSGGTPTGWHTVAEKHGVDQPLGMILRGRVPTGICWQDVPAGERDPDNRVTTRILWLAGDEPGRNAGPGIDSYARYIYIHGTNHPENLGRPASHGCVQLSDADVIRLFDDVAVGTAVWIGE